MSLRALRNRLFDNRLVNFLTFVIKRLNQYDLNATVASLTLSTLTAIVPTLFVILYFFSRTPGFTRYTAELLGYVASFLDFSTFQSIVGYLDTIPEKINNLSLISILFLLISSIFLLSTIEDSLNKIWQVNTARPLKRRILIYLLILIFGPISLISLTSVWNLYIKNLDTILLFPLLSHFIYGLLTLVLYTLALFLMFKWIPDRFVPIKDASLGAVITAFALWLMKKLFLFYIVKFNRYELIYGAFASIPLFIFYIYVMWFTLLAGAILTASLSHFKNDAFANARNKCGPEFEDIVRILSHLAALKPHSRGLRVQSIRLSVNSGYDALGKVLDELKNRGYLKEKKRHWKLKKPPEAIFLSDLFNNFVIPAEPRQEDVYSYTLYLLLQQGFEKLQIPLSEFVKLTAKNAA